MAIQEVFENTEWVSQPDNPVAYAPHLRKDPLPGVPARPVLIQFAKGDQTIPNPTSTAMLRAGDLADRATYYRHDLAYAEDPRLPTNPHGFLVRVEVPAFRAIALGAQEQVAAFFASDGEVSIHPEPGRFFDTPIVKPPPARHRPGARSARRDGPPPSYRRPQQRGDDHDPKHFPPPSRITRRSLHAELQPGGELPG
jgi:hypothetical protein